jgi:CheY-like chemotaxis protein
MSSTGPTDPTALAILIVDDEVRLVTELAEAIADEGYTVHQAHSAAGALAILAAHPEIGVMISDIRMPDGDGLELTQRVLEGRRDPQALEVILVTGHATLEDAVLAVRSGAVDLVRKPFRLQQIFDAIARAMDRAIGRRRISVALSPRMAQPAAPAPQAEPDGGEPDILLSLLHELRMPLASILGLAEELESPRASPAAKAESATRIGDGARRLLATVDDLVVLTRMEEGRVRPSVQRLTSAAFLQGLAEAHEPMAARMGTALQVQREPDLAFMADGALLRCALAVLLRIALQRAPGGSTLTLSATRRSHGIAIEIGGKEAPRAADPTASAEEMAWRIAPLGIRFARAAFALHGGSLILAGGQQTAFCARVTLPHGLA